MIQIFTCLTHNSSDYAIHLLNNLKSNASNPDNLIFSAIADDKFDQPCEGWNIVDRVNTPYKLFKGFGAYNHSTMLNKIINYLDQRANIIIVCDCDVAILKKKWDLDIIKYHKKYDVLITPKFSGKSSVYFTSFNKKTYQEVIPDYTPGTEESGFKVNTIYVDTGYRVQDQLKNHKVLFYDLEGFDGINYEKNKNNPHLHYLYLLGGKKMVTHFGASHKTEFESERVKMWIKSIKEVLKNE